MQHLQEEHMIGELWDRVPLTREERDHLTQCETCQQHFAMLQQMRGEFDVARHSQMYAETEARYRALFAQRRERASEANPFRQMLGALAEWVNALPLWDSRQQALAAGVRTANSARYRLLFGADQTEIELMIEPHNGLLRVVGEVMQEETDGNDGLVLVELMGASNSRLTLETESDGNGRFQLEQVSPGAYTLTITPRYNPSLVIERLELT